MWHTNTHLFRCLKLKACCPFLCSPDPFLSFFCFPLFSICLTTSTTTEQQDVFLHARKPVSWRRLGPTSPMTVISMSDVSRRNEPRPGWQRNPSSVQRCPFIRRRWGKMSFFPLPQAALAPNWSGNGHLDT